jgi:hypothetical protein
MSGTLFRSAKSDDGTSFQGRRASREKRREIYEPAILKPQ